MPWQLKPRQPRGSVFAQWLTAHREAKGWTMRALAEAAGVSHPRIVQLEAGDSPTREMAQRLAGAMGVNPSEALIAAGFLPDGYEALPIQEAERIPIYDTQRFIARYNNLTPRRKQIIDMLMAEDDKPDDQVRSLDDE